MTEHAFSKMPRQRTVLEIHCAAKCPTPSHSRNCEPLLRCILVLELKSTVTWHACLSNSPYLPDAINNRAEFWAPTDLGGKLAFNHRVWCCLHLRKRPFPILTLSLLHFSSDGRHIECLSRRWGERSGVSVTPLRYLSQSFIIFFFFCFN